MLNSATIVCVAFAFVSALYNETMLHTCQKIDRRLEWLYQRVEKREKLDTQDLKALRGCLWKILNSRW